MPTKTVDPSLTRFRTSRGELSQYALGCGYIQVHERDGQRVVLWQEGGPCYHVRHFDHNKVERVFWDTFESLTEARARYRQAKREIEREWHRRQAALRDFRATH